MSKINQFVSVVAYVHNNADKIEYFIDYIMPQLQVFKQCEIIFVDDCSTDDGIGIIKKYYQEHPADYIVSIIKMEHYHGMETAMNAGRDMSIGDYVYEFDSLFVDFEPGLIIETYNKCLEGNDIVTAGTDVPMKTTSKLFYSIFNNVMKSDGEIGQETFRLLSRRAINRIISMDVDIPYRKVVYQNSGLSTAKINYRSTTGKRPPRITEKHERVDLAIDSFIYFTRFIQHGSFIVALLFGLLCIATIVYTLISRSLGYHVGMGWTSTMVFLSAGFAGMFGFLTLIIRYLAVLVDLVFKKQKYLIADVEKICSK